MEKDILTKGNVKVNEIEIGDILYEFEYGLGIESKVLTKPELTEDGNYQWISENVKTKKEITYVVNPEYPHYAPNLYNNKAYNVKEWI